MKRINLLPQRLLKERSHRRARLAIGLAAIGLAAGGAAWLPATWARLCRLNDEIDQVERTLAPLREQRRELDALERKHQALKDRAEVIESLRHPLAPGAILALLSQVAPEGMFLRTITLELPATARRAGSNSGPATGEDFRTISRPRLQLEGMALEDVTVARLVSRLAECEAFQSVRLDDSREMAFQGRLCHLFRVSMDLSTGPTVTSAKARPRFSGHAHANAEGGQP